MSVTAELREKIAKKLEANPGLKTGMLADSLGVPETDVLRAMPEGYARELRIDDKEAFLRELERLGTVYFVIRNSACVTEITGRFGEYSKSGPFLNVSTEKLHLHLRPDNIESVFHITPPASPQMGLMPSLQFFQQDGSVAFKVFLIKSMSEQAGDDFDVSLKVMDELVSAYAG